MFQIKSPDIRQSLTSFTPDQDVKFSISRNVPVQLYPTAGSSASSPFFESTCAFIPSLLARVASSNASISATKKIPQPGRQI